MKEALELCDAAQYLDIRKLKKLDISALQRKLKKVKFLKAQEVHNLCDEYPKYINAVCGINDSVLDQMKEEDV